MKPWGKGSRTSNIEDLDIFKTTVFQIEATGNFKNLKRMQKISAINTVIYYNLQLFQNYMELNDGQLPYKVFQKKAKPKKLITTTHMSLKCAIRFILKFLRCFNVVPVSLNGENYIWHYTVLYWEIKLLTNSHCGFMCVS